MTLGLTIPGVPVVHPREEWIEECFPISGAPMKPQDIWQPVAHYSSALNLPDGDIGEYEYNIPPWLRASNRDYWLNRTNTKPTVVCGRSLPGYSLGYLWAVDWLGGAWELRGFDLFAAANAGHNHYTAPILLITDRHDPASDLAWATCRAIWREFRRRSGRSDFRNRPLGHGELYLTTGVGTPTACPGPQILAQLHAGKGDLDHKETAVMADKWEPRKGRLIDTRVPPLGNPMVHAQEVTVQVPNAGGAIAATVNLTAVGALQAGFLDAYPTGTVWPGTSSVNFQPGWGAVANQIDVQLDAQGRFTVRASGERSGGVVHLVADLVGLWRP